MKQRKLKRRKRDVLTIAIQPCGCICVFPMTKGMVINNSKRRQFCCNLHGTCYWSGCSCKMKSYDETD